MSYQSHAYPTKRRLKGPLHPPDRAPPTSYVTPPAVATQDASMDAPGLGNGPRRPSSIHDSPSKKRSLSSSGYIPLQPPNQPYPSHYPAAQTQQLQSCGEFVGDASATWGQHHPQTGAGDAHSGGSPALASAQRLHAQQQQMMMREDEQSAQPPPAKRRRGVAGAIVEGALNTALAAGAAAITAYSLWSTWGQRPAGSEPEPVQPPPGAEKQPEELPPPPYYEQHAGPSTPLSPTGSQGSSKTQTHVYLSSRRRRRPAFQSTKSARQSAIARSAALVQQQAALSLQQAAQARSAVDDVPDVPGDEEATDDDMDEDDTFRRFQERMSSLIAEGQAALTSQPNLEGLEDEPYGFSASRPRHGASSPYTADHALSPSGVQTPLPEPTKNFNTPARPRMGSHPSGGTPFDFNFTALPRTSPPGAGVGLTAASPWGRASPSPMSAAQRAGIAPPTSLETRTPPASSASPFVFGAPTPPIEPSGRAGPYDRRRGSRPNAEGGSHRGAGGQPRWH